MKKIRLTICGMVMALGLAGTASHAADVLQPNAPSLIAPAETTTSSTVAPAPNTMAAPAATSTSSAVGNLTSKPSDSLSLPNAPATSDIDPKDIPDIVMDEMKSVQSDCEHNYFYSSFHDCKCISVKFLDARIKSDPDTPKARIFDKVATQCVNQPSIAGYIYKSCADYMQNSRPSDYASFCRCTANDVAESYSKAPVMNLRYIEKLRRTAFNKCGIRNNPDDR